MKKSKKRTCRLKAVTKAVTLPLSYLLASEEGLTDYQLFTLLQKGGGR
ncbi:hypothetical protein IR083_10130 [Dysgonomonas sp. GY75]|nr:hypothetical protein [Dysgonomonas sp. GY75]MBF0649178.1 hypothetical protein [Dysgonomonas sp. GY75]